MFLIDCIELTKSYDFILPKELVLYPNKTDTVRDLLREAHKYVQLSDNGTGKLR